MGIEGWLCSVVEALDLSTHHWSLGKVSELLIGEVSSFQRYWLPVWQHSL